MEPEREKRMPVDRVKGFWLSRLHALTGSFALERGERTFCSSRNSSSLLLGLTFHRNTAVPAALSM